MPLLREQRDDLSALVSLTADALRIAAVFVEKDFWVTEVLRAATVPIELEARDASRHSVSTIFKGGTSLSRVYGVSPGVLWRRVVGAEHIRRPPM